ncbi:MAG: phosphatidate cytidylyltransferase [Syntrophobacterales bacterium]|nr:phosphatidate cytidylyltransferase [Syntrophobacterales bacterium]
MREIRKRVLAGLCLAPPIVFIFCFLPPKGFFIFVVFVSVLAVLELVRMGRIRHKYLLALLALLCLVPLYLESLRVFVLWLLFSPVFYLFAVSLKLHGENDKVNRDIMAALNTLFLAELFVVLPLFYFYLLKETGDFYPLILLFAVWASDIGAFIFGKNFGKKRLVPAISPKKTYEGLAGAITGSMVIVGLSGRFLGLGVSEALALGAMIGILGQTGDIFESIWKRVGEVKDSSSLIPGHGGILDRMDSFIFTAPFLYHYLAGLKV